MVGWCQSRPRRRAHGGSASPPWHPAPPASAIAKTAPAACCRSEQQIRAYFKSGGAAVPGPATDAAAAVADLAARFPPPDAATFARWFPGLGLSRTACDSPRRAGGAHGRLPCRCHSRHVVLRTPPCMHRMWHDFPLVPALAAGCASCASPTLATPRTCTRQRGRECGAPPRRCWCAAWWSV